VVTDPPGSRQAAEVPEKAKGQGETPEEGKGESTDPAAVAQPDPEAESTDKKDDRSLAFNEKLNWEDDKVPFREEFANLKNAYLELLNGDPIAQFIQSPDEFRKRMAEASPTGYAEIGTLLATESAEKHPEQWINYFKEHQPDLLAKLVTGKDDMTLDRLSAELEVLLAEDEPDVQAAMEKNKAAAAEAAKSDESKKAAAETPEQKEIREWREQRDRDQITAVTTKVFQPIEDAVDSLVSQAGLEVKDADYKGKNFTELDPDTQFKVLVNEMLPVYIDGVSSRTRNWSVCNRVSTVFSRRKTRRAHSHCSIPQGSLSPISRTNS
jgi:hypothetical protein